MARIYDLLDQNRVILLDGAMGSELELRGVDVSTKLWSAAVLEKNQKVIQEIHEDYLKAGANIITTISYQANIKGFIDCGFSYERSKEFIILSSKIAVRAKNNINKDALVAASIGPYGAYLADGSEFSGKYKLSLNEYKNFHREKIELCLLGGADILGIETIPNLDEARAICELLQDEFKDVKAWISFSAKELCLSSGEKISDMVEIINECENIFATGFNCTSPRFITDLVKELKKFTDKHIIIYPNSGANYNAKLKTWECDGEFFIDSLVNEWLECGVKIVGGCCKSSPNDILKLKNKIQKLL